MHILVASVWKLNGLMDESLHVDIMWSTVLIYLTKYSTILSEVYPKFILLLSQLSIQNLDGVLYFRVHCKKL